MTLVAAWLRQNSTLRELVVASDSRIRGGEAWDACPKIMPLPRPATIMAMSGDATEAYAFLVQALNACHILSGNISGQTDIGYFAKKLRDIYADSRTHVSDLDSTGKASIPNLDVVLLGWSWRRLRYEGFSYKFNRKGELWMDRLPLAPETAYPVYLFGDAAPEARKRLREIKEERNLPTPRRGDPAARQVADHAFFDWEPLEVLLSIIGDERMTTVGGAPQIARIYQYGQVETFVWRDRDGTDYYGGRPVQATERFDCRIARFSDGALEAEVSDRSVAFGGYGSTITEQG